MIHLPHCCSAVAALAADTKARYAMTCVRVRELAGSAWRVEATDGRLLGVLRGPSCPSPEDLVAAEALPEPEALAFEALLPASEFRRAFRSLPKGDGRTVGVLLARPQALLAVGGTVARCTPDDGHFPDVDAVLPKTPAPVSFRVDPDLLVALLKAAGGVARTGDRAGVEILFWSRSKPVGVIAEGADGVCFDGVLMPLA